MAVGADTDKPFWVEIEWGTEATRADNPDAGCRYEFDTEAELCAFMEGVEAAEGWHDYAVVNAHHESLISDDSPVWDVDDDA